MKQFCIIYALTIILSNVTAQETVAVLEFERVGVSKDEAKALSERFGTEFLNISSGRFILVERQQISEILKEQGLQQSGCTTSECAVQAGMALGAKFIIIGSITKVGSIYSVNARMLDVETSNIINSISHDQKGDIGTLLIKGMKISAEKLLSNYKKKSPSENNISNVARMNWEKRLKELSYEKIIYILSRTEEGYDGISYTTDFNGKSYGFRNSIKPALHPYWLPDGTGFIYCSNSKKINLFSIFPPFDDEENSKSVRLSLIDKDILYKPVDKYDYIHNPVISSDMNFLYFENDGTINRYDINNKRLDPLTFNPTMDYCPAISPNGKFLSWHKATDEIVSMDLENGEIEILYQSNQTEPYTYYVNLRPRWSPSGEEIVTANVTGLVIINHVTKTINQVTKDGGELGEFTADGENIIYIASNRTGKYPKYKNKHIRIVSRNGGLSKLILYKEEAHITKASPSPYLPN